jgi:hypothetical protein
MADNLWAFGQIFCNGEPATGVMRVQMVDIHENRLGVPVEFAVTGGVWSTRLDSSTVTTNVATIAKIECELECRGCGEPVVSKKFQLLLGMKSRSAMTKIIEKLEDDLVQKILLGKTLSDWLDLFALSYDRWVLLYARDKVRRSCP